MCFEREGRHLLSLALALLEPFHKTCCHETQIDDLQEKAQQAPEGTKTTNDYLLASHHYTD
jgi:hypothetical protein